MLLRSFIVSLLLGWNNFLYATCGGTGITSCTCTVAATTLAFGNFNPVLATAGATTSTVTVTCSIGALLGGTYTVSYTIGLSTGGSGSFSARRMVYATTNNLPYNMYTTAGKTTIWGNGTAGNAVVSDTYTGSLGALGSITVPKTYTVYGTIPLAPTASPGTPYSDTITATVTY